MSGAPNREAATPKPLMNATSKPACSMSFALRPSWQQGPCIIIYLENYESSHSCLSFAEHRASTEERHLANVPRFVIHHGMHAKFTFMMPGC